MAGRTTPIPRLAPLGPAPFPPPVDRPRRRIRPGAALAGATAASVALSSLGLAGASVLTHTEAILPAVHVLGVEEPAAVVPGLVTSPAAHAGPQPELPGLSRISGADRIQPPAPQEESSLPRLSRISGATRAPAPGPAADDGPQPAPSGHEGDSGRSAMLSGLSRLPTAGPAPAPSPQPPAQVPGLSRLSARELPPVAPPPPPDPPPEPVVPADAGALPLGKGMWLYVTDQVEGGNVDAVVERARQVGLTHIYVRTGSSKMGFYAQPYLDQLLEKAHASGLRVIGWDFPYLQDVGSDVARAMAAITYTTPSGDRIDGFAADIETPSEGTHLTPEGAAAYGHLLRQAAGPRYPLVAVVPRPSPQMQQRFPYAHVLPPFDAVAPMTYWLNRQPDTDVVNDVTFLAPFGKPVIPVGQAYDGAPEGGRPGPPPPDEIARFLAAAEAAGAVGASFWSWQHANQPIWDTIAAAPQFRWEALPPAELRPEQVRALQAQLTSLGHPVAATGAWDDATSQALRGYQERARLPRTGRLDPATLHILQRPFNPPVGDPVG